MTAAVPDPCSALRGLLRSSHIGGPDALPSMVTAAGEQLGASLSVLYLIDYDQQSLEPFTAPGDPRPAESAEVDATLAGRAFTNVAQQVADAGDVRTVWTPVLDGTDRLGVLLLHFPAAVQVGDDLLSSCQDVAGLVAELVMTRALYGDAIERVRRRTNMSVPAEMQWRLVPPPTVVSPPLRIPGGPAPAGGAPRGPFHQPPPRGRAPGAVHHPLGDRLQ